MNSAAAEQRAHHPPDHRLCPRGSRLRGVSHGMGAARLGGAKRDGSAARDWRSQPG